MDISLTLLIYIAVPIIAGVVGMFIKSIQSDILVLQEKIQHMTTEPEVRQLLDDKITPIRDDIHEIKEKLDKIFDLYIADRNK